MARGRNWSYSEEKLLIENYENKTIKELQKMFPNRSQESINNKIKRLKKKKKLTGSKNEGARKRAYYQR